ncbi:type II secretion system F family protein [Desulfonema magnum]|uniref:General secretion pathway protein, GspF-like n=1 Tax=Desulfonema magnum TaxID=45655 RepID=A0A975BJ63_9BACT|nr:type II secretion system F family protein [Desulfonema magnum]QTA86704.1 Putative general secretion pathway protein, GspF-like [Desulfonema magnum]
MPKFSYQAIDETGNKISGLLEAESAEMASNVLAARGHIPSKVKKIKEDKSGAKSSETGQWTIGEKLVQIKAWELILFTKQFRTMIRAGVPMLNLLQVMENQTENRKLKKVVGFMSRDIQDGLSLNGAFRKHPKIFSPLYCSVVQAGEASGELPKVLDRLTYIMEHEHKIKSDIKAALQYPVIVSIFLGIAFFVMLTFVIPTYVNIFVRAGIALPLPTQICILMYEFLSGYWYFILIGVVAGGAMLISFIRTEPGKYARDFSLMKTPVLGLLFIKATMSRFASIFAILQSSGVPILDSMTILSGTIGNAAVSREFNRIREKIETGSTISAPLKSAKYFTPMVVNMVAIGEESGNLDEMLNEITEHYDTEVEYAMKRISELIAPFMTVGMAAVVGFFALAIFLPMWDMTRMVK